MRTTLSKYSLTIKLLKVRVFYKTRVKEKDVNLKVSISNLKIYKTPVLLTVTEAKLLVFKKIKLFSKQFSKYFFLLYNFTSFT